tara:strand:+ start:264 stop:1100 length:837 start_codon:yes stop_codon:yes gene_type:complete
MINIEDITFVITTFKSEKVINNCLKELPEVSQKIIIENSSDHSFKENLERKYKNLKCHLMLKNIGYGSANNMGIKKSNTNYVFIINPDTFLSKNILNKLLQILSEEEFSIASVLEEGEKQENNFNSKIIKEVDFVKGFAMLINKKNMFGKYFDENIFLYLEEVDLCLNVKKKGGRIILVNLEVKHLGGNSHGALDDFEMEKSRNWHWMWSKFYFSKKHNGYILALMKTLPNFLSSLIKYIFYFISFNKKKIKYEMRLLGLINSYLLRKSYYRPYSKKV